MTSVTKAAVFCGALSVSACILPSFTYEYRNQQEIEIDGRSYSVAQRYAKPAEATPNTPWEFDVWVIYVDGVEVDCGTRLSSCARSLAARNADEGDGGDSGGSGGGGGGGGDAA